MKGGIGWDEWYLLVLEKWKFCPYKVKIGWLNPRFYTTFEDFWKFVNIMVWMFYILCIYFDDFELWIFCICRQFLPVHCILSCAKLSGAKLSLNQVNVQMLIYSNVQMFNIFDVPMFQCSNNQMFKCSNIKMFKCSNVQMFKCLNVQIFKCSNVPIFQRFNVPMFQWSNVQMFKCWNI